MSINEPSESAQRIDQISPQDLDYEPSSADNRIEADCLRRSDSCTKAANLTGNRIDRRSCPRGPGMDDTALKRHFSGHLPHPVHDPQRQRHLSRRENPVGLRSAD